MRYAGVLLGATIAALILFTASPVIGLVPALILSALALGGLAYFMLSPSFIMGEAVGYLAGCGLFFLITSLRGILHV